MKKTLIILILFPSLAFAQPTGEEILNRIDANMAATSTITTSKMVIHGARQTRTIEAKSWGMGDQKAFTEYLAPAREKGPSCYLFGVIIQSGCSCTCTNLTPAGSRKGLKMKAIHLAGTSGSSLKC